MKGIVVAGIGTEVGKTVASAVLVESLQADYWKPIQAGDLHNTDSDKVNALISNAQTIIHPEAFRLTQPMSPHAAADIDNIKINAEALIIPNTKRPLVIELAGGLMVPINHSETNMDLIKRWNLPVVLVVNFYLGSINHTLLSIKMMQEAEVLIKGLLFNGEINPESKEVILEMTDCNDLGTIPKANKLDKSFVLEAAKTIKL